MTSTLTHPRPTTNPILIGVATLGAAALVVLALAVWGSGGGEVAVRAPAVQAGNGTAEATAARHYDRLQELNTTYDGYNVAVAAPAHDRGAAACGRSGPC